MKLNVKSDSIDSIELDLQREIDEKYIKSGNGSYTTYSLLLFIVRLLIVIAKK